MAIEVLTQDDIETLIQRTVDVTLSKFERLHRMPALMNKAQVADYLGKPVSTINRYMREGMPFRKVDNGYPEFYKDDIDRWLLERFQGLK